MGAEIGNKVKGAQLAGALGGDINTPLGIPQEMTDALSARKTVASRDTIPSVSLPSKKGGISDVNLQSKSVGNRNTAHTMKITRATSGGKTNIPKNIPQKP